MIAPGMLDRLGMSKQALAEPGVFSVRATKIEHPGL